MMYDWTNPSTLYALYMNVILTTNLNLDILQPHQKFFLDKMCQDVKLTQRGIHKASVAFIFSFSCKHLEKQNISV